MDTTSSAFSPHAANSPASICRRDDQLLLDQPAARYAEQRSNASRPHGLDERSAPSGVRSALVSVALKLCNNSPVLLHRVSEMRP